MSREKSVRAVLAACCTLSLALYIAAPVFGQGSQPPATDSNTTSSTQQNTGTSNSNMNNGNTAAGQSNTASQPPEPADNNSQATAGNGTPVVQQPTAPDQARTDNVARASVPWGWVIGSFIVGLIVGGLAFGGRGGTGRGTYYEDRDVHDEGDFRRAA